jgi:hypothetical protein
MARKKIDPLNKKQYSAVSAALTRLQHSGRGDFLPKGVRLF